jgi:nucleotide-binding universal stress UspA family protein
MRWIVGIGTERGRGPGALHFARWLAGAGGARPEEALVAVHVLSAEHLRAALRWRHLGEVVAAERAAAARRLAATFGGDGGPPLEIVQARTVEDGLEEACAGHGAAGVIVARAAPGGRLRPVRLGPVVRGLLRRLACPVIVCPPDLEPPRGGGAVVALADAGAGALAACRFARAVAAAAGRDVAIAPVEGAAVRDPLVLAERRGAPLVALGAVPRRGLRGALVPKLARRTAGRARLAVLVVPAPVDGWVALLRSGLAMGRPA